MSQRNMLSYLGISEETVKISRAEYSRDVKTEYPDFKSLNIEIPLFLTKDALYAPFKENFKEYIQHTGREMNLTEWVRGLTGMDTIYKRRLLTINGKMIPESYIGETNSEVHKEFLVKELTLQGKDMLIMQHDQCYSGLAAFIFNPILENANETQFGNVSASVDISFNPTNHTYLVQSISKDIYLRGFDSDGDSGLGQYFQPLFSKDTALGFQQKLQPMFDDYKEERNLVTNDYKLAMVIALSYLQKLAKNDVKPSAQELQDFHGFFLKTLDELYNCEKPISSTLAANTFLEYLTLWGNYQKQNDLNLNIQDEKLINIAVEFSKQYLQNAMESEITISPENLQKLNQYFVSVTDLMINPFSQRVALESYFEWYCQYQKNLHKGHVPKKSSQFSFLSFMSGAEEKTALKDIHGLSQEAWDYIRKNIIAGKGTDIIVDVLINKIEKYPEDILIIYLLNLSLFFKAKQILEKNPDIADEKVKEFLKDASNPLYLFNPKQFLKQNPDMEKRKNKVIEKLDLSLENIKQFNKKLKKMENSSPKIKR